MAVLIWTTTKTEHNKEIYIKYKIGSLTNSGFQNWNIYLAVALVNYTVSTDPKSHLCQTKIDEVDETSNRHVLVWVSLLINGANDKMMEY